MSNNRFPQDPALGDMVALSNRVIMVWVGTRWYLVGGERLPLVDYQSAVNYLLDAWGESESTLRSDLDGLIAADRDSYYKDVFITRAIDANQLILEQLLVVDELIGYES